MSHQPNVPSWARHQDCPHRKQILRQNAKGRDVFRCLHIRNIQAEAVLESCAKCGDKTWSCENCPGYDRATKKFVYQLVTRPPKLSVPAVRPLRVAFQTRGWNLGGAERWIASLCQHFDRTKIRPTVIGVANFRERSPVMLAAIPEGIEILPLHKLRAKWNDYADFVIHWGDTPLDGKLPAVSCLHHSGANCPYTKKAVNAALTANVPLVGVNEACREVLPLNRRKLMTVIPNGADESRVIPTCGRAEIRASLGIRPDQRVVAHIGRVMRDKDVPSLAKAVGELPDWTLLVCGPLSEKDPLDLNELKRLAKGRLRYEKPRDHVGDFLSAADVFALLSPSEAHPLSVNEAWLAGVPVVCTDLPWIRSIEAEYGGLVTKVNSRHEPKSIADAILRAHQSKPLAIKAQALAMEQFTAKVMARRWEEYLLNVT